MIDKKDIWVCMRTCVYQHVPVVIILPPSCKHLWLFFPQVVNIKIIVPPEQHGMIISTITEAKHIFLYKRRPHSNPHPSAPNWQIWCMVCTGLKGHNSNQKTLELKCTKECRSRVAQGLKSPWSQQQGNPHGWCSNCSHCPRTSCTKESI